MDGLPGRLRELLVAIQDNLLARAKQFREEHTHRTSSYDEFKQILEGRPGFVVAPWCGSAECEARIKAETQATIRNMPLRSAPPSGMCVRGDGSAVADAWFAKAY